MSLGPVVAILGLSGSGKSHLARSIAKARPEFLRLSAGSLLRSFLHTTGEKLRTADGADVLENQSRLADALADARSGQMDRPVLLEAHSFIDNDRELVDVPVEVIASLGLAGILLIDVPAADVAARRTKDIRKRPRRTLAELKCQRDKAKQMAQDYASELNIPLISLGSDERDKAIRFVDQFGT